MRRLFNNEFVKGFKKTFTEQIFLESFGDKDALSGKELVTLTPSKQLNFLIMKALFQEWQTEMKRLESPYFDYKHAEVKKALVQFMNLLSQHIEVKRSTLEVLISTALDEAFVLVTDPAQFIRNEYGGRERQTYQAKHAKPILKYLKLLTDEFDDFFNSQAIGTYAEVFEIADDYFADVDLTESQERLFQNLSEVTPIRLDLLLDEEEFADITLIEEDMDEELDDPEPETPKSTDEQEVDDFQSEDSLAVVEEKTTAEEVQEMPPNETESESVPEEAENIAEAEADVIEEEVEFASTDDPEASEEETPEPEPEIEPEPEPEIEPEAEAEPDSEPTPESGEESREHTTLNDQFSGAKEESLVEKLEKEEQPGTILSSVSVNQKYMFVQELFQGDANTFQTALSEIEHSGSFDDAVEHLVTNFARQFNWDMNSDEVKELLKVIFRRFR